MEEIERESECEGQESGENGMRRSARKGEGRKEGGVARDGKRKKRMGWWRDEDGKE